MGENKQIMQKFVDAGAQIYIVGGASRDTIMGREINDWDYTTNLTPEEILKLFPKNSFYKNKFGTVSVVGKNKEVYEITTFRKEHGYTDNRHPDSVTWGQTVEEDLQRRDFTFNAIAVDIEGKIIDPFDGQSDIKNKVVRTVGKPEERFEEDGLRMMRAIRLANQLNFVIDDDTFKAIQKMAENLKNIANERVRDEFFKILGSETPKEGVVLLLESGLMKYILPELLEGDGFAQNHHHTYDVLTHNLEALANCESKNVITRLACLLHDSGKPRSAGEKEGERTFYNHEMISTNIAYNFAKKYNLSVEERVQLTTLVRWHMFTVDDIQTDKAIRRWVRNLMKPEVTTVDLQSEMISLRYADRIGSGSRPDSWRWQEFRKRVIEVQQQPFCIKDLKINGQDVMSELNLAPGPKVGEILKAIFAKVDEDVSLNEREKLMTLLESFKK